MCMVLTCACLFRGTCTGCIRAILRQSQTQGRPQFRQPLWIIQPHLKVRPFRAALQPRVMLSFAPGILSVSIFTHAAESMQPMSRHGSMQGLRGMTMYTIRCAGHACRLSCATENII